jgi:4-alpha-glucanotransferase
MNAPSSSSSSGLLLFNWLNTRAAGALLHPTALPNDQGVGVLDRAVDDWLAFLSAAGIGQWQVCPLGPTGYGDSPYQCFSAFAGNPYLIDLRALVAAGLLTEADVEPLHALPRDHVDFGWLYVTKWPALFHAHESFKACKRAIQPYGDFEAFRREHAHWLDAYALFMALKDHFNGQPWQTWPEEVRFFARAKTSPLSAEAADRAEAYAFAQ